MASPEQKLKRFLHYGREVPTYIPGSRLKEDIYHPIILSCIDDFVSNEKTSDIVACILKSASDGYSAHPEMLVYALAYCAKQKVSEQLRAAAYKAVKTVCSTPDNLFLFVRFAKKLSPSLSVWGSGLRKAVRDWYLNKDPKTLAEIIMKNKSHYGWSHKDLIKQVHLKAEDPAMLAIIKYILYDLENAKKEFGNVPGTNDVLNYIQSIEDFKSLTDMQQAARTVESLSLSLDHVPPRMLKNREVWNALIENLPLGVLIRNLERMGYLGFLEPDSPLAARVLEALRDDRLIAESRLHPVEVYITMYKYKICSKFMMIQKIKKLHNKPLPEKPAPKPNAQIVIALNELFLATSKLLAPTGLRYLITLHVPMVDKPNTDVIPLFTHYVEGINLNITESAMLTVLSVLNADRNVDVNIRTVPDTYIPLPVTKGMTMEEAFDACKTLEQRVWCQMGRNTSPMHELQWAMKKEKEYDVFICIMKQMFNSYKDTTIQALDRYRQKMNAPNAKVIIMQLWYRGEPAYSKMSDHPGVLSITGFDSKVPRIIEAFSRGAF